MTDNTANNADAAHETSPREEFSGMVDELLKNNTLLRRRGPLVRAFEELAFGDKTSDSVKFRALDRISDFMDKAEQHENTDDMAKNIRAFVQLFKRYIERKHGAEAGGELDGGDQTVSAGSDVGPA